MIFNQREDGWLAANGENSTNSTSSSTGFASGGTGERAPRFSGGEARGRGRVPAISEPVGQTLGTKLHIQPAKKLNKTEKLWIQHTEGEWRQSLFSETLLHYIFTLPKRATLLELKERAEANWHATFPTRAHKWQRSRHPHMFVIELEDGPTDSHGGNSKCQS